MKRHHDMPFGATVLDGAGVRFRLWAPGAARIELELGMTQTERLPMQAAANGWHELDVPNATAGARYRFVLPDGIKVPDPASRSNPDDVSGPSAVVDPGAHSWRDMDWQGRPWHEAVVYELHVGTFTEAGTFNAARERLTELADLGFTAIELMPLADFPGHRGWGYDGVLLYAPDSAYGSPEDLKAFIDAAHALGVMVLIDVVYNHFGPDGNFLHAYCPTFFNPEHQTPWGAAINYDGESSRTVRDFMVHNALYWLTEFHADGLRMDAVHAIRDDSAPHLIEEIAQTVRERCAGRHVHIVLENEENGAAWLARSDALEPTHASAQWNDDIHHAVHVLVTGETDGYYVDYAKDPLAKLGRALAEGFIYQGDTSEFRGNARGEPSAHLPQQAFVSFLQTHDQIGNRAMGERIHMLADPALLAAAYACVLLSPHVPMLVMGEEYAASTPFLYFCDFHGELAEAISKGRRNEFKRFAAFNDEAARAKIPDPNAESTFTASKLKWAEREQSPHREQLAFVRELLALRHRHLVPRLKGQPDGATWKVEGDTLRVDWPLADGARWHLLAHFGTAPAAALAPPPGETLYSLRAAASSGTTDGTLRLEPGGVVFALQKAHHD